MPGSYTRADTAQSHARPLSVISIEGQQKIAQSRKAVFDYAGRDVSNSRGGSAGALMIKYFQDVIRYDPNANPQAMKDSLQSLERVLGFTARSQRSALEIAQLIFDCGLKIPDATRWILQSLKDHASSPNKSFIQSLRVTFPGFLFNNGAACVLQKAAKDYADAGGDLKAVDADTALEFLQMLKNDHVTGAADQEAVRVLLEETPDHVQERIAGGPPIVRRHAAVGTAEEAVQTIAPLSSAPKRPLDSTYAAEEGGVLSLPSESGAKKQAPTWIPPAFTRTPAQNSSVPLGPLTPPSSSLTSQLHPRTERSFSDGLHGADRAGAQFFVRDPNGNPPMSANVQGHPTTLMPPCAPQMVTFQRIASMSPSAQVADMSSNSQHLAELMKMFPDDPFSDPPEDIGFLAQSGSGGGEVISAPVNLRWLGQPSYASSGDGNTRGSLWSQQNLLSNYLPSGAYDLENPEDESLAVRQGDPGAQNTWPPTQRASQPTSFEDFLRQFDAT